MSERLFRRVATRMRGYIRSGEWPIGLRLPAEPALAAQFGVSRTTIRQALGELAAEGLLHRRKRHGTSVAAQVPDGRFRMDIGDLEQLLGLARDTLFDIQSMNHVAVAAVPLPRGMVSRDTSWLRIIGGRHMPDASDERPFSWSWIYVAGRYADVAEDLGPGTRSVYRALETRFGVRVARVAQSITALACPAPVADQLGLAPGSPALQIKATLFDNADEPLECTRSLFNPARFQILSDTRILADS